MNMTKNKDKYKDEIIKILVEHNSAIELERGLGILR